MKRLTDDEKILIDTLIVSDLHFRLRFSRFFFWRDGSNAKALLRILNRYRFHRLIVNGDLWHDADRVCFDKYELEVLQRLRNYACTDSGVELVIILGNHDRRDQEFMEWLIGTACQEEYTFIHQDKKYLVTHGDCFDQSLRYKWWMWLADYAERFARLAGIFMLIKRRFDLGIWRRIHQRMTKKALKYAQSRDVAYILLAHSHIAGVSLGEGVACVNSGCFIDDNPTVIVIAGNEFEIHQFDRQGNPLGLLSPVA